MTDEQRAAFEATNAILSELTALSFLAEAHDEVSAQRDPGCWARSRLADLVDELDEARGREWVALGGEDRF